MVFHGVYMNFIACVNRILQEQGIIRGDTDTLVSFSDTTHASTSSIAQIAVQNEISDLMSRQLLLKNVFMIRVVILL